MFSIGIRVPKGTNVEKIKSTFDLIGWGERIGFGTYSLVDTDYYEVHFNHATKAGLSVHEELKKKNKFMDSWELSYTMTMDEYCTLYKL